MGTFLFPHSNFTLLKLHQFSYRPLYIRSIRVHFTYHFTYYE